MTYGTICLTAASLPSFLPQSFTAAHTPSFTHTLSTPPKPSLSIFYPRDGTRDRHRRAGTLHINFDVYAIESRRARLFLSSFLLHEQDLFPHCRISLAAGLESSPLRRAHRRTPSLPAAFSYPAISAPPDKQHKKKKNPSLRPKALARSPALVRQKKSSSAYQRGRISSCSADDAHAVASAFGSSPSWPWR